MSSIGASRSGMSMRGIAFAVVAMAAMAACNRRSSLPPLPTLSQVAPTAAKAEKGTVEYRSEPGSPIAPTVVPDEPPPAALAPAPSSDKGSAPRATLNGDPNGITRETLNRSIQGAMGALASCFASMTEDPMVAVSFEAEPSGHPSLVRISGAPPDAEHCVRNVVQNIRFPSFDGKGVQVDLPLSFHRVTTSRPQANNQPAQPTGPSLFLQP